jgi:hypothetical protein
MPSGFFYWYELSPHALIQWAEHPDTGAVESVGVNHRSIEQWGPINGLTAAPQTPYLCVTAVSLTPLIRLWPTNHNTESV